jgi:hypothetical protein
MTTVPTHPEIKKQQRTILAISLVVAGIPIMCQVLMLLAHYLDAAGFPNADRTFVEAKFWPIQIVLLCVAIAGNAIVNTIKLMFAGKLHRIPTIIYFLIVMLFFPVESIMFSVTLLDTGVGWGWLAVMFIFGAADLFGAYLLEMEIALIEGGVVA